MILCKRRSKASTLAVSFFSCALTFFSSASLIQSFYRTFAAWPSGSPQQR